jgi:AraC family transcriptional regulator
MCCQRCIDAVWQVLTTIGLEVNSVQLGEATFANSKVPEQLIISALKDRGFEIIIYEEERIVESIKIAVIEIIHHSSNDNRNNKDNIPIYLEKKILNPYRFLNKIFLKHTNLTIQRYTTLQRIEKVKALIEEHNCNFSEIADLTGYKTAQHLSGQFKKIVGVSMLEYKAKNIKQRKSIDEI